MSQQPALFSGVAEREATISVAPNRDGEPRVLMAERNQIELRAVDLEATLGADHPARRVGVCRAGQPVGALR